MGVLKYGRYTYGVRNLEVQAYRDSANVLIGNFCSIARHVRIVNGGVHPVDLVTTYPMEYHFPVAPVSDATWPRKPDIRIGNDVWLAQGCTILGGVTIGDGAVVAAGAIVTKDVPPYTIVGGVPAKALRRRFTDEQVDGLLAVRWWDLDHAALVEIAPILLSRDVDLLIATVATIRARGAQDCRIAPLDALTGLP